MARFDRLSVADKMRVIELVNQADSADLLSRINDKLADLDLRMRDVADWFRNSKVYFP